MQRDAQSLKAAGTMKNGPHNAQKFMSPRRKMIEFSSVFFKICFHKSDFFNSNDAGGSNVIRRGD